MDNLNNIPNVGNWGDAASKLNDNFNKIKQSLTTVENASKNNKGYFTSLSALNTAFPSPKAGQTAYVYDEASSTNYYIYNAVNGAWASSTVEAPSVGVDIAGYTKTGGSTKTTKDIDDLKAEHGYATLEVAKTLKEVDDDLAQLEEAATLSVVNIIKNSSFKDKSLPNWYHINDYSSSVDDGVVTLNGRVGGEIRINPAYETSLIYNKEQSIYASVRVRTKSVNCNSIRLEIYYGGGSYATTAARIDNPVPNQWYNLYGIAIPIFDSTEKLRIGIRAFFDTLSVDNHLDFEKITAFDLTDSFIKYGIPYTKDSIRDFTCKYEGCWVENSAPLITIQDIFEKNKELEVLTGNNSNDIIANSKDIDRINSFTSIPVVNIVVNGDFSETSYTNWLNLGEGIPSIQNNEFRFRGKGDIEYLRTIYATTIPYLKGQKMFVSIFVKTDSDNCDFIRIEFARAYGYLETIDIINNPIKNQWYHLAGLFEITEDLPIGENIYIWVRTDYATKELQSGSTTSMRNFLCVDTSKDFDAVNISYTEDKLVEFINTYENSWFDNIGYYEIVSDLIMNRSGIKQPVGFLNDWKNLANGVAQYSMYVGYDNILYFSKDNKEWKMTDITDDATLVEGRILSDNPRYSVRFPDKFIQVYNVTVGDTTNIEVRKKINFEDVPEVIHTFEGVKTERLSCSSHYDGVNEFIFIGEYMPKEHNFPCKMWFSKDGGVTFNVIKETSFVNTDVSSHWHTGVFDPYQGRIWVSEGDGEDNRGVHFSDDYGETWTMIDSQLYQPTLIVPFSEKVFFGRDSTPASGFDVYVKPKKIVDFDTAPVFQDALTFLPNEPGYAYYPSGNYARNNNEVYVSFAHMLGTPSKSYIYATGDCGESWHCVYSGLFPIRELMYKDGYVIGHADSINGSGLYFTKALDWV